MTVTTSREFNQTASGAKNAAQQSLILTTNRGRPACVQLTIED